MADNIYVFTYHKHCQKGLSLGHFSRREWKVTSFMPLVCLL